MSSLPELKQRLAKLDARLASGVESAVVDGTSTKLNMDSMRKEREAIKREIAKREGTKPPRKRIKSVWLGGI